MKYTPEHSYVKERGIKPDEAQIYADRICILLMRGEFLAAWFLIAEAYETKHAIPHRIPLKNRPLADSTLPIRIINALETKGILTWGQLSQQTPETIKAIENLSETSLKTIQKELRRQINLD